MHNPYHEMLAAPGPGSTFTVPGAPPEEEATQAAVDYGWLIGLAILVILAAKFGKFILGSKPVQILAAMIITGYIVYTAMKG